MNMGVLSYMGVPELIVMLTHNDVTVSDAADVFERSARSKARLWGFKEVGLAPGEMKRLVRMMKDAGKATFLEVVAYTEAECLEGARLCLECGFDTLMGTVYFDSVMDTVKSGGIKYMPFVGELSGRPTVLSGRIPDMIGEAARLIQKGCDGIDLLGYRYTGDAARLNAEFVAGVEAPVCIAGSIQSYKRLDEVKAAAPWSFTIGGAFFENRFGDGGFAAQIDAVIDYMNA